VLRPDDGTAEDLAQAVLRRLSALVEEPITAR
jgi:hypothetical protein